MEFINMTIIKLNISSHSYCFHKRLFWGRGVASLDCGVYGHDFSQVFTFTIH